MRLLVPVWTARRIAKTGDNDNLVLRSYTATRSLIPSFGA